MPKPMTTYPILFNQTPDSLRRIGARGGRACARNRRLRSRAPQPDRAGQLPPEPLVETTAQAIAKLDAQFPWLGQAERRTNRH